MTDTETLSAPEGRSIERDDAYQGTGYSGAVSDIERIYGDSFLDISDLTKLPVKLAGSIKRFIRV